jgi:hypothetical protein
VAAAVALLLVGVQVVVRQDERSWAGRVAWQGTATLEGHLVWWEWTHVYETVALVDGEGAAPRGIGSQNVQRFVGGFLLSVLRKPLGGTYAGATAAALLAWLVAAWALYALTRMATGSAPAAVVAAALTAAGAGFAGYLGQIDPHPFGYAAVAVWLMLAERLEVFGRPRGDVGGGVVWLRPVVAGLGLAVAGFTMEVGLPLLLFSWLFYGLASLLEREPPPARTRLARLASLTGGYLVLTAAYQVFVGHVLFRALVPFNDPETYLRAQAGLLARGGPVAWAWGRIGELAVRWSGAYPWPLSLLALAGLAGMPRRWALWAVLLLGSFLLSLAVTKPAVRELYLAFPAVYVPAAWGTVRVATWVASLRVGLGRSGSTATGSSGAPRPWVSGLVAVVLVLAVLGATNADLWGDYGMAARWYACKVAIC